MPLMPFYVLLNASSPLFYQNDVKCKNEPKFIRQVLGVLRQEIAGLKSQKPAHKILHCGTCKKQSVFITVTLFHF
jgi:hypothetical protein